MGNTVLDDPKAGETGTSTEQEFADSDLITRLRRLINLGDDGMSDWREEWSENTQFYLSHMWDEEEEEKRATWRSLPTLPKPFTSVETIHAVVTDQPPESFCYPRAGGNQETAEMIGSHLSFLFDDLKLERKNSRMWRYCMIKGNAFWKVWWDQSKGDNGEIQADIVKPENLVVDPFADTMEEARFVAERTRVPLSTLLEKYPELYERLKGATDGHEVGTELWRAYQQDRKDRVNGASVEVWEIWFIDSTMVEEDTQTSTADDIKRSVRKYPNGRVVLFTGDVKLEDSKNPYKFEGSGKRWPYVKAGCIENIEEFYDTSIVGPIKDMMREINEMEAAIQDNIKTVGNPKIFATEGAVDTDSYTNTPGSITEVEGEDINKAVMVKPGIPISPDVFKHLDSKKKDVDETIGITDALTGSVQASQRPGSVKAAFEASMGRLREMIRMNNAAMEELGEMMVDLMQENYAAGRIIYLSNDEGTMDFQDPKLEATVREALNDPKVQRELNSPLREGVVAEENPDFPRELQNAMSTNDLTEDEAKAALQAKGVLEFKHDIRQGRYKYRVAVHPMQARDKGALVEQMTQVLQYAGEDAGAILPHLIEALDWPGRRTIMKEIRESRKLRQRVLELQQQLESSQQPQQAEGQPGGPPPGQERAQSRRA